MGGFTLSGLTQRNFKKSELNPKSRLNRFTKLLPSRIGRLLSLGLIPFVGIAILIAVRNDNKDSKKSLEDMPYQFSLTESTSRNVSTALKSSMILIPIGCMALAVAYVELNNLWEVIGWLFFENIIISLVWLYVIYEQNKRRLSYSETRVAQLESRFNTRPEPSRQSEPETEPVQKVVPFQINTRPERMEDTSLPIETLEEVMKRLEAEKRVEPDTIGYRHHAPTPSARG